MKRPTDRQQQMLDFIRKFREKSGYSPSVRDIAEAMGIGSPNGVFCHLKALKTKGLIDWTPSEARSIVVLDERENGWRDAIYSPPTDEEVVLVFVPLWHNSVWTGVYDPEEGWLHVDGLRFSDPVTHWQPLPAPPTESV